MCQIIFSLLQLLPSNRLKTGSLTSPLSHQTFCLSSAESPIKALPKRNCAPLMVSKVNFASAEVSEMLLCCLYLHHYQHSTLHPLTSAIHYAVQSKFYWSCISLPPMSVSQTTACSRWCSYGRGIRKVAPPPSYGSNVFSRERCNICHAAAAACTAIVTRPPRVQCQDCRSELSPLRHHRLGYFRHACKKRNYLFMLHVFPCSAYVQIYIYMYIYPDIYACSCIC